MEKTCKICGKTKSLEDFPKDKKMADGHVHQCRVCVSARQKKYKSRPEVKEHIRKSRKAWSERNQDRVRRNRKAWEERNPDKVKANDHAKRARKRDAAIDWKSTNELEEYWISIDIDPWRCYYCSCEMIEKQDRHIEHMTPLCRNGTSLKENLVPSCVACNQAKHSMTAEEFIGKTNE